MIEAPAAPLRLALDEAALIANWRALGALSGTARAGAAVKADGYGTGARRVVKALASEGCADFFVAHACEAAALLDLVPASDVAVLHGPASASEAAWMRETGVRPVINTLDQARRWTEAGGGPCQLMVDTGINRLGLSLDALGDAAVAALEVEVLHSHLACADEDSTMNAVQQARWLAARKAVPTPRAALANSAGIVLGAAYHGELTRPGLSLYGGIARPELAGVIRQVVAPEAAIIQVRDLAAGDSVGYNSTFIAPAKMRVGVVALGYADGYLRAWSGKGVLRHHGRALPVLGRVSMDMTVVDLTAAPDLREGDWVRADYDLPAAASRTRLSQYELLTLMGRRFSR